MKYIVLLLLILIVSCESSTEPEISVLSGEKTIVQYGESLFPMSIGNIWEYEYKYYENDELIRQGERRHEIIDLVEIENNGQVNDCFRLEEKGIDGHHPNSTSHYYYGFDSDGFYIYGHNTDDNPITILANRLPLITMPISKDQQWSYINEDNNTVEVKCKSTDEIYNINGNSLNSVVIEASINGVTQYLNYYVKGIGLVLHLSYSEFNGKNFKHEYRLIHNVLL